MLAESRRSSHKSSHRDSQGCRRCRLLGTDCKSPKTPCPSNLDVVLVQESAEESVLALVQESAQDLVLALVLAAARESGSALARTTTEWLPPSPGR